MKSRVDKSLEARKSLVFAEGAVHAVLWQLNAAYCGWGKGSPVLRKEGGGGWGARLDPHACIPHPSPRCACP